MDDHFQMTQDGTELTRSDVNAMGEASGLAGDRVLGDAIQVPYESTTLSYLVRKGILPFSACQTPADFLTYHGLLEPTGSGDASVRIWPFRAVVSPRATTEMDSRRDIRTGKFPTDAPGPTEVALDPTAADNRVDLIYARVELDVDGDPDTRWVKSVSGSESAQSVSVTKRTVVSLEVVKGTEAASPTRPSLPTDADPVYYIPLAYVWLVHPFTGSTTITRIQIEEVAPFLGVNHGRLGTVNAGPCNRLWAPGSWLADSWGPGAKPPGYVSPSMAGGLTRFVALDQKGSPPTLPGGTAVVLDDSVDWRRRAFKVTVQAVANGAAVGLAWDGERGVPAYWNPLADTGSQIMFGQSFDNDGPSWLIPHYGGMVARIYNGWPSLSFLTGVVYLAVDYDDGALYAYGDADCGAMFFIWLEATGQLSLGNLVLPP